MRRSHHVDIVADQVLPHARRCTAADDGHAEARQHQQPGERLHALHFALDDRRGAAEQNVFILNLQ
jgi:hypothetical protein